MGKRRKTTGGRKGVQVFTLCISTTMVLVLLGLMVFSMLTANNLSKWVKENLTVTVMLGDTVTTADARGLCRDLQRQPYAKQISYISKEQALKEQTEAMGSDPSEFLGVNPFPASIEMQLHSDYANADSLRWIAKQLKKNAKVSEVAYQEDLMDKVNLNLQKLSVLLLVLAALLTFISYSLISNTVRLSVYARRFLIHTMKLVGASWGFIRGPFMRQFIGIGLLAAILACVILGGFVYVLYVYEPSIVTIITERELLITAGCMFLFGVLITAICTWLSVNRFLRMTAGELYKI